MVPNSSLSSVKRKVDGGSRELVGSEVLGVCRGEGVFLCVPWVWGLFEPLAASGFSFICKMGRFNYV